MVNKLALASFVKNAIVDRMEAAGSAMAAAQASANEESKSSAGDKYETGRAMAQNQRDLYARQYEQARQELLNLEKLGLESTPTITIPGSLVETTLGWIFISVSLGAVDFEGRKIWVVSPQSPIAQAILHKASGEPFTFQRKIQHINTLY